MFKLFGLLVVGLALNGCQLNSHRYPGLVALNELVTGEKVSGRDVLIVACSNHPSDYSDRKLCDCAYKSIPHAQEAEKRGLNCGVNKVPHTQIAAKTKIRQQLKKEGLESDLPLCSSSDFFNNCLASNVFENGDKLLQLNHR